MKKSIAILFLILVFLSCKDEPTHLVGEWQLSSYDIGIPVNINSDARTNKDLLLESNCPNNEILKIEKNYTLSSTRTFAPKLAIRKVDNGYLVDVQCIEGTLGFATGFSEDDTKLVLDSGDYFTVSENGELNRTYKDFIKIYNADMSSIVATKDLRVTYVRK